MRKHITIAAAVILFMAIPTTAAIAHDPIVHLWETVGEILATLEEHDARITALEGQEAEPTPEPIETPEATVVPTPEGTYRGLIIADEDRCSEYDRDDYRYPASIEDDIVEGMGGIIYSPYTGEYFDSTDETDIEHIVAVSEAHDSGMCAATDDEKDEFARDLLNLTLASPSINRHQKRASDAAEWLPELNQCWFADTIVKVRVKYELTVDQTEADALEDVLEDCESVEMVILPEPVDCELELPEETTLPVSIDGSWIEGCTADIFVSADADAGTRYFRNVFFNVAIGTTDWYALLESDDADTYIILWEWNTREEIWVRIGENDDVEVGNTDSRVEWTPTAGNDYALTLTTYPLNTSGDFTLTIGSTDSDEQSSYGASQHRGLISR